MEFIDDGSRRKLRLTSKRLKSGKIQVKFQVSGAESSGQYGYLLTEPKAPLKEVVAKILNNYSIGLTMGYHRHLYNLGGKGQDVDMLIFK